MDQQMTIEEFIDKYHSVLTEDQFSKAWDLKLGLATETWHLSDEGVAELDKKLVLYRRLDITAERNNNGILFEKNGAIEDAIKVYEENIAMSYPATHAFERLMIIYRKLKKYNDEIRVIQRAIKVFSNENESRFKKAFENPINKSVKNELQIGLETCTNIMGTNGFYAYCP